MLLDLLTLQKYLDINLLNLQWKGSTLSSLCMQFAVQCALTLNADISFDQINLANNYTILELLPESWHKMELGKSLSKIFM